MSGIEHVCELMGVEGNSMKEVVDAIGVMDRGAMTQQYLIAMGFNQVTCNDINISSDSLKHIAMYMATIIPAHYESTTGGNWTDEAIDYQCAYTRSINSKVSISKDVYTTLLSKGVAGRCDSKVCWKDCGVDKWRYTNASAFKRSRAKESMLRRAKNATGKESQMLSNQAMEIATTSQKDDRSNYSGILKISYTLMKTPVETCLYKFTCQLNGRYLKFKNGDPKARTEHNNSYVMAGFNGSLWASIATSIKRGLNAGEVRNVNGFIEEIKNEGSVYVRTLIYRKTGDGAEDSGLAASIPATLCPAAKAYLMQWADVIYLTDDTGDEPVQVTIGNCLDNEDLSLEDVTGFIDRISLVSAEPINPSFTCYGEMKMKIGYQHLEESFDSNHRYTKWDNNIAGKNVTWTPVLTSIVIHSPSDNGIVGINKSGGIESSNSMFAKSSRGIKFGL